MIMSAVKWSNSKSDGQNFLTPVLAVNAVLIGVTTPCSIKYSAYWCDQPIIADVQCLIWPLKTQDFHCSPSLFFSLEMPWFETFFLHGDRAVGAQLVFHVFSQLYSYYMNSFGSYLTGLAISFVRCNFCCSRADCLPRGFFRSSSSSPLLMAGPGLPPICDARQMESNCELQIPINAPQVNGRLSGGGVCLHRSCSMRRSLCAFRT